VAEKPGFHDEELWALDVFFSPPHDVNVTYSLRFL
jgi:hypothetical protein